MKLPAAPRLSVDMPVLVCFAVRQEARFFKPAPDLPGEILVTGIGGKRAGDSVSRRLASGKRPGLVLTCGFAGGLNPAHPLGRVLFDSEGAPEWVQRWVSSGAVPGRFVHSDRVVVTAAEKARLYRETGADAVEMESSVIVRLCRECGIPVTVLRVISDTAGEDLPMDFNRYSRPDGSLSVPRLLLGMAASPGAVPRLIRFNRCLTKAAQALGAVLFRGLLA